MTVINSNINRDSNCRHHAGNEYKRIILTYVLLIASTSEQKIILQSGRRRLYEL
jgi:hypothetical protein